MRISRTRRRKKSRASDVARDGYGFARRGLVALVSSMLVVASADLAAEVPSRPPMTAQTPSFRSDSWQREHGLPQISVTALAQDAQGYLWIGTDDGLARFDGLAFEVFDPVETEPLPSRVVRDLLLDRSGDLWIATRQGLDRYRHGRFSLYTSADGLANSDVHALCEDSEGVLWVGTENGLSRFADGVFRSFTAADGLVHGAVRALAADPRGVLWIGAEGGLGRLEGGRFTSFDASDGLPHDNVRSLLVDSTGVLWIGTGGGLARFAQDGFETLEEGLAGSFVSALAEDREGRVWIGTDDGLSWFENGRLTVYPLGFSSNERRVRALWQDHEGSLWLGAGVLGLVRLREARVKTLGREEGLVDDLVWTLVEDGDDIWIGSNQGLTILEAGGRIRRYLLADGLPGEDVRALASCRQGGVWLGTNRGGVARLHDGEIQVWVPPSESEVAGIRALHEDAAGDLWVGTGSAGGLRRLSGSEERLYTAADGLPDDRVWAFHEDLRPSGGLWIGTEAGLVRYQGERFEAVAPTILGRDVVKALHQEVDGTLWVGTEEGGLVRYRDGEISRYTVRDGLFDRLIHAVLDDGRGGLWMSSNQGVSRVEKRQLEDFAAGRIDQLRSRTYGESDGMRSRECNGSGYPAGLVAHDGRLWFPTIRGVSIFDPDDLEASPVPPVHVEEILVDRRPLDDPAWRESGRAEVAPGVRDLEIRYAGLSFLDTERIRFRCRLEGFDREWTDVGPMRSARYTNLAPGEYRFRVLASSSGGLWNEVGASVAIYLRPAFYQTWPFYLACALGLALGARSLFRLRIGHLLHRDRLRMLEEKNAEMESFTYHICHDLKSPLVTIRGFTWHLRRDLEKNLRDRAEGALKRIDGAAERMGQLLDELMELSKAGQVETSPEEIDLEVLAGEAVDLVAGQIAERGVEVRVAPGLPRVFGDPSRLRRVFQNLIDNGVKYMADQAAPRIDIGACREGRQVVCRVRDNGRGIVAEDHSRIFELFDRVDSTVGGSGIGLALVKRVVESHGGKIWVESDGPGRGSTFCFTLPVRREDAGPASDP